MYLLNFEIKFLQSKEEINPGKLLLSKNRAWKLCHGPQLKAAGNFTSVSTPRGKVSVL